MQVFLPLTFNPNLFGQLGSTKGQLGRVWERALLYRLYYCLSVRGSGGWAVSRTNERRLLGAFPHDC